METSNRRAGRPGRLSKTLGRLKTLKRKLSRSSEEGEVRRVAADPYYDEMAREVFEQLGRKKGSMKYNSLDSIFKREDNGATVYVGNIHASRSAKLLEAHNITAIVNCTVDGDCVFKGEQNAKGDDYRYLRFSIAEWSKFFYGRGRTPESILEYVNQMLDFVEDSLSEGRSVLIHCLAGAHRAGTTGVLYLMAKHDISQTRAVKLAKELRPIIDPIGTLKDLLAHVEDSRDAIREDEFTEIRHWK